MLPVELVYDLLEILVKIPENSIIPVLYNLHFVNSSCNTIIRRILHTTHTTVRYDHIQDEYLMSFLNPTPILHDFITDTRVLREFHIIYQKSQWIRRERAKIVMQMKSQSHLNVYYFPRMEFDCNEKQLILLDEFDLTDPDRTPYTFYAPLHRHQSSGIHWKHICDSCLDEEFRETLPIFSDIWGRVQQFYTSTDPLNYPTCDEVYNLERPSFWRIMTMVEETIEYCHLFFSFFGAATAQVVPDAYPLTQIFVGAISSGIVAYPYLKMIENHVVKKHEYFWNVENK